MNEEKLDRSGSQPGKEELIRQNKIANESMGLTEEILNSKEWADLKWEIGQILMDNVTLSEDGKFMELNPATHILSALFYHQSNPQPSQPVQGDGGKWLVDEVFGKEPPLTEQGKEEEPAVGDIIYLQRDNRRLKAELAALKSKPTDGWSDEDMEFAWEESFRKKGCGFDEFLSSYKAKQ